MSEDRKHDVLHDEKLSEAYRGLSTEQTSAQLDKAILDMAKDGVPKRSLSRLLAIKPLAWGATVVLTVTLVVHLQQLEVTETLIFEDEVAADLEDSAPAPRQDDDSPASADLSSFAPAAGARAKIQEVEAMIVEQDIAQALKVSSRVYCLQEGRISLEGATGDVTHDQIIGSVSIR